VRSFHPTSHGSLRPPAPRRTRRTATAQRKLPLPAAAVAFLTGSALALACASSPPAFEEVPPADELYAEGLEILEGTDLLVYTWVDYSDAIEVFQRIIDNYPYSEYAIQAELQIADAYFEDAKYEEALSYYRDFADLHPQNEKVPYSIYRSALCYERRKRGPNRDQSATREAIVYLDRLLSEHPLSEYAPEAEQMWRELQLLLAENMEGIGDFYRGREEYEAAAERYRTLLNEYPGLGIDARILFKLAECYEEMDRLDEADRIFRTIMAHYADSEFAYRARRRIATGL
jgi:outer membrane protein assembly factor BamD